MLSLSISFIFLLRAGVAFSVLIVLFSIIISYLLVLVRDKGMDV